MYPISLPDNLTTPARAVTLATAYYPEMRTDAQQMLGYVFPSLDVVTGFALYLEETYGGVGETWLTTLVEGISLWPDPPLIDNQAKAKAYIESLLPYVNSLHARLLAVIKPGKPRLKASLSGGEKSWRPQSPRQIERNKAKTARRKKPS
ncbi:MAG TPA: hypothetical protein VHP58_04415 [Alphaproteobacteria bacterium]|nr:hypothetical protein [Alphaproteobacteria bacterium]